MVTPDATSEGSPRMMIIIFLVYLVQGFICKLWCATLLSIVFYDGVIALTDHAVVTKRVVWL